MRRSLFLLACVALLLVSSVGVRAESEEPSLLFEHDTPQEFDQHVQELENEQVEMIELENMLAVRGGVVPIIDNTGDAHFLPQVNLTQFKVKPVIDASLEHDAELAAEHQATIQVNGASHLLPPGVSAAAVQSALDQVQLQAISSVTAELDGKVKSLQTPPPAPAAPAPAADAAAIPQVGATPQVGGALDNAFQTWMRNFGKNYVSIVETARRGVIWLANKIKVATLNARAAIRQGLDQLQFDVNGPLADLTEEEFKRTYLTLRIDVAPRAVALLETEAAFPSDFAFLDLAEHARAAPELFDGMDLLREKQDPNEIMFNELANKQGPVAPVSCRSGSRSGVCQEGALSCPGTYVSGLCAGKTTRCCLEPAAAPVAPAAPTCASSGRSGICQSTSTTCNGDWKTGLCPGSSRCCLRPVDPAAQAAAAALAAKSVDWRNISSPVKNQQQCGSCWAFTAAAVMESAIKKKNGGNIPRISPQQIVDCNREGNNGCSGGNPVNTFAYWRINNPTSENKYRRYASNQRNCTAASGDLPKVASTGYANNVCFRGQPCDNQNEMAVVEALRTYGPMAVIVDASQWQHYRRGIMDNASGCGKTMDKMNHAVVLVGVNLVEKYWIVRNSWATTWGEAGYLRMKYGENTCGIANFVAYVAV